MDERIRKLNEQGQSLWLDYLDRKILDNGQLASWIDHGITGVTTNPTIFQKAISSSELYDESIRTWLDSHPAGSPETLLEQLMVEDVTAAADLLCPVHDRTEGQDGFVSLEVSPLLARDTEATRQAVQRLHAAVARPNVMIKIPGTVEGLPAIRDMLTLGIPVNITLLFSVDRYRQVLDIWHSIAADRPRSASVASVASFFVSRIDTRVDALLQEHGSPEALALRGRAAVANARLAWSVLDGHPGSARRQNEVGGGPVQRLLWGSTGTKNPDYSDLLYVDELVGPNTVNTVPPATLEAFLDHGDPSDRLSGHVEEARGLLEKLQSLGIDLNAVTARLEDEGVAAFTDSWNELLQALEGRRRLLA